MSSVTGFHENVQHAEATAQDLWDAACEDLQVVIPSSLDAPELWHF